MRYCFASIWLCVLLQLLAAQAVAQECCATPACQAQARSYAQQLAELLAPLGKCPTDQTGRQAILASYQRQDPARYTRIEALARELKSWSAADNTRNTCLLQALNELDDNYVDIMSILDWSLHLVEALPVAGTQSAEFCREFAGTFELNQGVVDIFSRSESYFLSAKAFFLVETFGVARGQCGGRVRLWLGGGLNYQDRGTLGLLAAKAEYRLADINVANLTSIGHFKAILEPGYGFGPSTFQALAGVGADVHVLQVQVLGGYQSRQNRFLLHFGLAYTFTKH